MNHNDNPIALIEEDIRAVAPTFEAVLAKDSDIIFVKELEFAMQVFVSNEYLAKVARQNPQSMKDAVVNVAACGISLNPAKKQAYLVPRKKAIVLVISYMGMIDLAVAGGSIRWAQAIIAREKDHFRFTGPGRLPEHEFDPFATDEQRGAIRGVYSIAKTIDGDYLIETMSIEQVYRIRDRSDAWKAYARDKSKTCPWNTDEEEMIKKTVIRRAAKTWPKVPQLKQAISLADENFDSLPDHGADDCAPAEPTKSMMPQSKSAKTKQQAEDIDYSEKPKPAASPLASEGARNILAKKLGDRSASMFASTLDLEVADDLSNLTAAAFNAMTEALRHAA